MLVRLVSALTAHLHFFAMLAKVIKVRAVIPFFMASLHHLGHRILFSQSNQTRDTYLDFDYDLLAQWPQSPHICAHARACSEQADVSMLISLGEIFLLLQCSGWVQEYIAKLAWPDFLRTINEWKEGTTTKKAYGVSVQRAFGNYILWLTFTLMCLPRLLFDFNVCSKFYMGIVWILWEITANIKIMRQTRQTKGWH